MICPAESTLLLFAEKLDDSCREHIETCAGCRTTVAELERTIVELRAAALEATVPRSFRISPSTSSRRLFFVAAAAFVIVTAIGLIRLGAGARPKDPSPAPPSPAPAARDEASEMASKGLAWLANNQKATGSFGSVGLTGLALQAFFASGHGVASSEYGATILKALGFLQSCQKETGQFGGTDIKFIYDDAIAGGALVEAVEGKRTDDPRVRRAAEKSVAFLVAAQNPGKGWRYSPKCGDNDTSVTYWAASTLAAARRAGFKVPDEALAGAKAWVKEVTDPATLAVGYNARGTGKVYIPGINDAYLHHPTMSAAAMALRLLAGDAKDEPMASAVGSLVTDPPSTATVEHRDYYYWHLGTTALYLHEGADTPVYKEWRASLLKAVGDTRQEDGSWAANDRWAKDDSAGVVYATAINVLTLGTERRLRR